MAIAPEGWLFSLLRVVLPRRVRVRRRAQRGRSVKLFDRPAPTAPPDLYGTRSGALAVRWRFCP